MEKTYYPKPSELSKEWFVADANGQNLGRFATQIAHILIGKHKPDFTPGVDNGDYVVIVNCERIEVTGKKMDDKMYYRHTGYPGGLKEINLRDLLKKAPDRVLRSAIWGMLPKNSFGRGLLKNCKIYAGPDHPHGAQNPKPLP
ncbi:MAG: 50S ribosomal protein L13 [Chloroflexi bacterium]|nr:50S ribosomal protein L13 [Chloroflexota bacterium]MBT3669328.1 50S ribosomal protein L13 [Chloroflexota bacterium]MBT4003473.1 50S ribosomal protein L13 [Chloroflexota bacterium]MBT4306035.1 50S ribosomal protein L13 [Chloroflexota bacterium]MBT4532679.1 50S ribosomal protein L13 [Chloroflexota bacterium]